MVVGGLLDVLLTPALPDPRAISDSSVTSEVSFDEVLTPLLPLGVDDQSSGSLLDSDDVLIGVLPESAHDASGGEPLPTELDESGTILPLPLDEEVRSETDVSLDDGTSPIVAFAAPAVSTLPAGAAPTPDAHGIEPVLFERSSPTALPMPSDPAQRPTPTVVSNSLEPTDDPPEEGVARALERLIARAQGDRESPPVPPSGTDSHRQQTPAPMALPRVVPMSATAEATPIAPPSGAMPPVQTLIGKDGQAANGLTPPPATALLATTHDKQSNETAATTGDAPAETRTSWQSALPRELRELAQTPAPHPELARRNADWTMQTLAERTMLLRAAGQSGASVTLEPESLGRVEVHVRVHSDTTHVSFTVQHAAVRDVVEANLPRLRTMLEDAGLTLGDVNVGHSDQGSRQSRFDGERRIADGGTMAREDASPSHRVAADRLVDVRV